MALSRSGGFAATALLIFALLPVLSFALPGGELAEFTFTNGEGEVIELADFEGRVVVLGFFADCESAGRTQALQMERSVQSLCGPAGVEVIGVVDRGTSPELVERFVEFTGISYPVLVDTQDTRSLRCPDSCAPLTMVIDQRMRLRYEASSGTEAGLVTVVNSLLGRTKIDYNTWGKIKELFK